MLSPLQHTKRSKQELTPSGEPHPDLILVQMVKSALPVLVYVTGILFGTEMYNRALVIDVMTIAIGEEAVVTMEQERDQIMP